MCQLVNEGVCLRLRHGPSHWQQDAKGGQNRRPEVCPTNIGCDISARPLQFEPWLASNRGMLRISRTCENIAPCRMRFISTPPSRASIARVKANNRRRNHEPPTRPKQPPAFGEHGQRISDVADERVHGDDVEPALCKLEALGIACQEPNALSEPLFGGQVASNLNQVGADVDGGDRPFDLGSDWQ